jgi:ABC-type lipoprotein release transport system permease subunit
MSFFLAARNLFSFVLLIALAGVILGTPLLIIGASLYENLSRKKKSKSIQPELDRESTEKTLHPVTNQHLRPQQEMNPRLFPSQSHK